MMYLTKRFLTSLNLRAVGIFKVLSITKLANISESLTVIVNTFNYYLPLSFHYSQCTELNKTCLHVFPFINLVFNIYRINFGNLKWCSMFINFMLCRENRYFYDNDNDKIEIFIYFSVMEYKTIVDQKIIIILNIKLQIIFPDHFVVEYH